MCLPLMHPQLGIWPATQACSLTGEPFGSQAGAPYTEPHQSGLNLFLFNNMYIVDYQQMQCIFLFWYIFLNHIVLQMNHTSSWFPLCPSPLGPCRDLSQVSHGHRRGHCHSYPCAFPLDIFQSLTSPELFQFTPVSHTTLQLTIPSFSPLAQNH